jgi:hypothetical protein
MWSHGVISRKKFLPLNEFAGLMTGKHPPQLPVNSELYKSATSLPGRALGRSSGLLCCSRRAQVCARDRGLGNVSDVLACPLKPGGRGVLVSHIEKPEGADRPRSPRYRCGSAKVLVKIRDWVAAVHRYGGSIHSRGFSEGLQRVF